MVFFGTVAIGIDFCNVLQRQDRKPVQYICFSSDNLDIVALQKPATINISFCIDTIAAVEKTTTICDL